VLFLSKIRLTYNQKALYDAHERLLKAVQKNNDEKIYSSIGELLLWVLTSDEWHLNNNKEYRKRRGKSDNGKVILGLRHAYNAVKHNMDFIKIHKSEGGFFPLSFKEEFFNPVKIHWVKADGVLEGEWASQKRNYEQFIEGKEVLETFNMAINFLNQEYSKVKVNH
jgi:hypothetical protein